MGLQGFEGSNRKAFLYGIFVTTALLIIPAFAGKMGLLQSFVPLPVFYYLITFGERQGRKLIGIAAALAAFIALLSGTVQVLLFSYLLVPIGFTLAHALQNGKSVTDTALRAIFVLSAIMLLFGLFSGAMHQSNPYKDALTELDKDIIVTSETIKDQYKDLPLDTRREIDAALEKVRLLIPRIMPSLLVIMVLSTVWLNIVFGHFLLAKKDPSLSVWGNMREWRLPEWFIWIAIVAGVFLILPFANLNTIGFNVILVFATLYFFQGLAVLGTHLVKWNAPPAVRFLIYSLLLLLQIYTIFLLIIIGVADIWIDSRNVEAKNTEK